MRVITRVEVGGLTFEADAPAYGEPIPARTNEQVRRVLALLDEQHEMARRMVLSAFPGEYSTVERRDEGGNYGPGQPRKPERR